MTNTHVNAHRTDPAAPHSHRTTDPAAPHSDAATRTPSGAPTHPGALAGSPTDGADVARMPLRTAGSAVVMGIVAFGISWAGSWVPSFWGDEAVSIMSARRAWSSLFSMLGSVDAIQGTYYALLHVWIDFFGSSAFSTRLPSAVAVGFAAVGLVVLVSRYGGLRLGILSALVFAVLPRTTSMGAEATSYALATACAVWLGVLFLSLVTRRTVRALPWVGFAVAFGACIYVFLYLCLLVLPFAAMLLWDARGRMAATRTLVGPGATVARDASSLRATIVRWMLATLGGIALASPLLYFAIRELGRVEFRGQHPATVLLGVTVTQWFEHSWGIAIISWAALLGLAAAGVAGWRRRHRSGARRTLGTDRARLVFFAAAWLVLPAAALLVVSQYVPGYTVRYVAFTTPALGILLAVAIDAAAAWAVGRVRSSGTAASGGMTALASFAGLALVAAAATPTYVAQRGPYAKDGGSDWADVGAVIQQHAKPGDDIAFDETAPHSRRPRLAMHLYPKQFADVVDVTLAIPYENRDSLWDQTRSLQQVSDRIAAGDGRVWLIEYRGGANGGVATSTGMQQRMSALRALGFTSVQRFPLHRDVVYLFTKGATS